MHVNHLQQCLLHNKCKVNTTIVAFALLTKLDIYYLPLQMHFIPSLPYVTSWEVALHGLCPRAPLSLASWWLLPMGGTAGPQRARGESI